MKTRITFLATIFTGLLFSETQLTGIVNDSIGPLKGANIIVKHAGEGAISNVDCTFALNVKKNDTLVVSYMGYNTQNFIIDKQKELNIVMGGSTVLDEVVLTSYIHTKCRYLTCCGAMIKYSQLDKHSKVGNRNALSQSF